MREYSQAYIQLLAEKKLLGTLSEEEDSTLNEWIEKQTRRNLDLLSDEEKEIVRERLLRRIMEDTGMVDNVFLQPVRRGHPYRWIAAASLLLLLVGGLAFLLINRQNQSSSVVSNESSTRTGEDVAPGKSGAILTLSNGKKVVLDGLEDGEIAEDESGDILKKSGQLVYGKSKKEKDIKNKIKAISYNTVTTPRAREFQIVLADGTKVWLNAESSITYPTRFTGADRSVLVTGEAYFEVAKDEQLPFIVEVEDTKIKVLGTHFNVMAYPEEGQLKTTLLEGSVEVSKKKDKQILKPGQQARIDRMGKQIQIAEVDADNVIAWIDGKLSLDDLDVGMIMEKLSRWYDVDIQYEGTIPEGKYWGVVNREVSLQNMLKVLSANGIEARLENKTIVIGNKA